MPTSSREDFVNGLLRHGLYSAEAISERRELAALIRSMRGLMKEVAGPE